jgi:hypothetical protein
MNKLEKILLIILTIGVVLKLVGLPGGAFLIVLISQALMLYYFPFGVLTLKGGADDAGIPGYSVAAGIAMAAACLAIMFVFQRWPGASIHRWYGLLFPLAILVFSGVKSDTKDFKSYHGAMKLRSGLLFVLVLIAVIRHTLIGEIQ